MVCAPRNGLDYDIRCRTSQNPQGPWTPTVDIFSSGKIIPRCFVVLGTNDVAIEIGGCNTLPLYNGETYGASFHPWYDNTQKSFVMWFTCGPNIIQSVNVVG